MLLTAYSCLAISKEYFLLSKAAFQEYELNDATDRISEAILLFVGLRSAALNNPNVGAVVVDFDDFCNLAGEGIERYVDPENCNACEDISDNMVISLMISVVSFLPSFFPEQLRMYSGYDVNCIKVYLTILGAITFLLNLNVIISYTAICGQSFYDGTVLYDAQGNVLPPDTPEGDAFFVMEISWTWGWGLIMLVLATGLKLVDLLCNCCVPTPAVTRDRREQDIYETIGMQSLQDTGGEAVKVSPPAQQQVQTRSPETQQSSSMVASIQSSQWQKNQGGVPAVSQSRNTDGVQRGPPVTTDPSPLPDPYV